MSRIARKLVVDVKVPHHVVRQIYAKTVEFVIKVGKIFVANVARRHILGVTVKSPELHTDLMLLARQYITNSFLPINQIP
jgi:hypothetical protein